MPLKQSHNLVRKKIDGDPVVNEMMIIQHVIYMFFKSKHLINHSINMDSTEARLMNV
jgi:hypothetical protein